MIVYPRTHNSFCEGEKLILAINCQSFWGTLSRHEKCGGAWKWMRWTWGAIKIWRHAQRTVNQIVLRFSYEKRYFLCVAPFRGLPLTAISLVTALLGVVGTWAPFWWSFPCLMPAAYLPSMLQVLSTSPCGHSHINCTSFCHLPNYSPTLAHLSKFLLVIYGGFVTFAETIFKHYEGNIVLLIRVWTESHQFSVISMILFPKPFSIFLSGAQLDIVSLDKAST